MSFITRRWEPLAVVVLTVSFLALALYNIGLSGTPTTTYTTSGGDVFIVDLGAVRHVDSLLVLVKDGESTFRVQAGSAGNWGTPVSKLVQGYYHWVKIPLNNDASLLRVEAQTSGAELAEIAVVGESDQMLLVSSVSSANGTLSGIERLTDEQDKVALPITVASETNFDEVYFVRAAEDYLEGNNPYENTHPPLGKETIALGIAFLGYSPYGWRVPEAIFAALMIPALYVLAAELTGSKTIGLLSGVLLSLDFMHFTYARIATLEVYTVFFSVVSWVFFLRYLRTRNDKHRKYQNQLLWALTTGLAISTKWYTLFGLLGQIAMMFVFGSRLIPDASRPRTRPHVAWGPNLKALAVLAVVSGTVYLVTYLPHVSQGLDLSDIIEEQIQMLTYHTTLTATHPYSSPWYSWPIMARPLWMYVSELSGNAVSTIVAMGNPAVWWLGFAALVISTYKLYKSRSLANAFIPVLFFSQWLPYALMTRPLFIYHYYVNVPLLCLAVAVLLRDAWGSTRLRPLVVGYLILSACLFFAFYPVISGSPVQRSLVDSLRWFSTWVF